ncbi:MAG: hypothetical protein K6T85_10780 [Gorillibacterium sp.]|nr:hypothetical protein [Gorillibacterium sp.]
MKRTAGEQAFLDEVYTKARSMEYDKLEEEKVRFNQQVLVERRNRRLAGITLVGAAALFILYFSDFDSILCIFVSIGLILLGIILEKADLLWHAAATVRRGNGKWN